MVPAKGLVADQLHEPLSNFLKRARFELDGDNVGAIVAKKEYDETDVEDKVQVSTNPNTKDWLQLALSSPHETRKADLMELELYASRFSGQGEKQVISSFKRQRNTMLGTHVNDSCGPVIGGDFTVVSTPRRPEAGIWLVLSAAQNQLKEPLLPQIEKSYLRVKDSNMTVRPLMKYLASKLGLKNETEVEICCKGQSLPPFLMLKYVRDHIWSSKDANELPTRVAIADHVMTLNYRRRRSLSE